MKTIHPAIAEHVMEENERLRGLLREAIHCCPDEQLRNEMKAALSQQAEPAPAQDEQTEQQPVAWLPYLSDGADGVTGHYAIARNNPAGYREVWNLRCHCWASASDEVLTLDEALAILKKLEMPTAPIAQTAPQHDSDCSTNNRGAPDLLGPCDCSLSGDSQ